MLKFSSCRAKLHSGWYSDMIAANSLRESGAGFGTDTNHLTLITKEDTIDVPMMTKEAAADVLLDAFSGGKRFLSGQEISN